MACLSVMKLPCLFVITSYSIHYTKLYDGNFMTDKQAVHPPFPNEPATFAPHSYDESPTVRIATFGNNSINEAWSKLCAYVEKEYGVIQPVYPDCSIVKSFWNYRTTGVPRPDYRVRIT